MNPRPLLAAALFDGWDKDGANSLTTPTIGKGNYAFFFNQRGLRGGLGLQGSKITRIHPLR